MSPPHGQGATSQGLAVSDRHAFIYSGALGNYQLSPTHPFKPERIELTRDLLHHADNLGREQEHEPDLISERELLSVHVREYVEIVKAVSGGERLHDAYRHGLGTGDNPIFDGMHDAVLGVCAATCTAVELVASGRVERAVNLSGGLHHALADRASGFCVYNDLALGIEHATRRHGLRVAYIDIDAHHGDGVQWFFFERSDVMTISLHESGRYLFPGTGHPYEIGKGDGRGLSVNAPLEPFTDDESFIDVFDTVVPVALRAFQPDLLVLQAGADAHRNDPLADLALSTHGMAACYQRVSDLADELCQGRLVATGGGGYDAYRTVPRAWALLWGAVSRQKVPEALPEAWRQTWRHRSAQPLPETLHDDVDTWEATPRRREVASHNRIVAGRLLESLTPIWKERFGRHSA